jgi:hypothetical protein
VTAQLSEAVGGIQVAIARHEALANNEIFDGQDVITGGVISFTTTLKEQRVLFPAPSVNV